MSEGRWVAVSAKLLYGRHKWHPLSTGEQACRAFAWIDLIGLAAWKDEGGLKRGQARASQRYLAARWNWSRGKVARFLDELESEGAISRGKATSREPDRITICNYDRYQDPRSTNDARIEPRTGPRVEPRIEPKNTSTSTSTSDGSNETGQPDVENSLEDGLRWNARLAPHAREAGGESKVGDWLRKAKPNPDYYEKVLIGLVSLRDRGELWVDPGEPMSPAILSVTREGQPLEKRAIAEYWRMANTPRSGGGPGRIQVEVG